MTSPIAFLRRLFWPAPADEAAMLAALEAFRDPAADTLELGRRLIACLRPHNRRDAGWEARYRAMLQALENDAGLRDAFRRHVVHFIAARRMVTFFTSSGILPGTGFFSEWWRILWNHLLPEPVDERRLKDCLHILFQRPDDWRWLEAMPADDSRRLWDILAPQETLGNEDWRRIEGQMLDAVLLLAHRISGLGVEDELLRAAPDLHDHRPRFIALSAEALVFVEAFRAGQGSDDGSHLLVIVDQCRETLQQIRKRAQSVGTSLHLSYLLLRGEQSLERLTDLVRILAAAQAPSARHAALTAWSEFAAQALLAENRRNSLRRYLRQLSDLLAIRVTENAARSGEHYICDTPAEYRHMWRSAAGAGLLIGGMALLKIEAAALHAPLLIEAFLFSMIYGLGFVLIYLLGMTVATKQPAMTAQTLAGLLGEARPDRSEEMARLVDVAAAVSRSQLAAIAGNVLVALPVAIAVGWGFAHLLGHPLITLEKGAHLLDDLDILGWALPHAALAGFYLYLSGLITGYFDNQAAYGELGARVARLNWLRRGFGSVRAAAVGEYLQAKIGGIMGNFLFGCMLGSTGVIGKLLGLPLDIRHIAFASANLGYALNGFQFELAASAILWGALGIAAIGLTNLAVSFALALRTALGARDIRFTHWGELLQAISRRLLREPRSFLLPPKG